MDSFSSKTNFLVDKWRILTSWLLEMVDFLTPVEGSIICSLPWPTPEFTHFYLVKSLQFWLLGKPWPEKQSTGCAFALELEECWKGHEVGPAPFVGQKCGQLFEVFKWNLFFRDFTTLSFTYKRPKQNGLIRHCDKMKKESHRKKTPGFW